MTWVRRITFIPEGVMVKLAKEHEKYFVERTDKGLSEEYKLTTEAFEPFRTVIELALFSKDDTSNYLTEFDPPFELWVPYTEDDLARADRVGRELVLGWEKTDVGWVPFTDSPNVFRKIPDKCDQWAGYGIATVKEWDDPPIAWGT